MGDTWRFLEAWRRDGDSWLAYRALRRGAGDATPDVGPGAAGPADEPASATQVKHGNWANHPPAWCDAHHIRSWTDGGETSLDNTVLLCGYHHRLIHKGEWAIQLGRDRRPEFLPPEWIDPDRRPLPNTMHQRR